MSDRAAKDLVARPLSFIWAWGLPVVILVGMSIAEDRVPATVFVLSVSGVFVWMGAACLINARRCGRLHCFVSGPVFLVGAVAALLVGFGAVGIATLTVEHSSGPRSASPC